MLHSSTTQSLAVNRFPLALDRTYTVYPPPINIYRGLSVFGLNTYTAIVVSVDFYGILFLPVYCFQTPLLVVDSRLPLYDILYYILYTYKPFTTPPSHYNIIITSVDLSKLHEYNIINYSIINVHVHVINFNYILYILYLPDVCVVFPLMFLDKYLFYGIRKRRPHALGIYLQFVIFAFDTAYIGRL